MEVSYETKSRTTYDPAIPLLSIYLKEIKSLSQRDICISIFIAALFTIAKRRKQLKCLSEDKMEYYLAIKKKEILPSATTWTDFEAIMLREINQTEKDKYCMISLICGINKHTNKLIDTEHKMVVARSWGLV